jgi:sugar phosphate isomerase/epimerase
VPDARLAKLRPFLQASVERPRSPAVNVPGFLNGRKPPHNLGRLESKGAHRMSQSVVGAQLYTLREFTKTPSDLATTLKKVKEIGYDIVQVSAICAIDYRELRKMLDGEGLRCVVTHTSWDQMKDEPERVIENHQAIGCDQIAVGAMPGSYRNVEGFRQFAKDASEVARKLKEGGLTWSYHNHSFEFVQCGDKKTGLHILFEESDPSLFNFEIDTYWVQHGGGDAAEWIRKARGRIPCVHFKDMAVRPAEKGFAPVMAEVGEGNLNWPNIIEACKASGTLWYLVEQDTCYRDQFESLKISLENLKALGLQ